MPSSSWEYPIYPREESFSLVGMPVCRPLGNGLWEIRSDLGSRRIARVIFCVAGERMVLLHAFIKKTRTTPDSDMKLARRRMKEIAP